MPNIVVPTLGESVVEARVAKWLKQEGQAVAAGEPVVELETEKIDLEVSAERAGVLASIKRQEGEDVKIGELLAVLEERPGGVSGSGDESGASGGNGAGAKSAPAAAAQPAAPASADEPRSTPTARSIARAHDVNLGSVQGSGTGGRVMKQDVQAALGGANAPAGDAGVAPTSNPVAPVAQARPASPPSPVSPAPRVEGERSETRQRMSKRRATSFQLTTFQIASRYSSLRFSYWR